MADLRDAEADLRASLTRLERSTAFAEVLAERTSGEGLRFDRRTTSASSHPRLRGAVFRAWAGTRWVEATTSGVDPASLGAAASALEDDLKRTRTAGNPPGTSATTRGERTDRPAHPMSELGIEGMLGVAKEILGWATQVDSVRDCNVRIEWDEDERFYLNTVGARCYQRLSRATAVAAPLAFDNGRVEFDFHTDGRLGGREAIAWFTEEHVRTLAESARAALTAKAPPSGTITVLLDPSVAGTFAHESFGHGTEADQFARDRSYLKPLLGQTLGPEFLTLVDNGAIPDGWGSIYFDDEGHPGQRTVLVDHGTFVGALHDRETGVPTGSPATGNTRRADFESRAFVRMTNTYVEPGDWTLEELVEEAKDGVLLENATSSIEDPLGGQMQLKVKHGRLIEHGRLTDVVGSMALSGKVLDVLKSTRGVGRADSFTIDPGYCGKGHSDMLPAGTGGVYLLSTAVVGVA